MKNSQKLIALICSLLLIAGVFSPAVVAAETEAALSPEQIEAVENQVAGELVSAEDGSKISVSASDIYDTDGDGRVTASEIAGVISKYAFAPAKELAGCADEIAENSVFTVTVTKDGVSTVYIAVPLEKYPQLFNAGVFDGTVRKLAEKQKEYKTDGMTLLSYQHIAGELALHAAAYAVSYMAGGDSADNAFRSLYNGAKTADLNIDENRLPSSFIRVFGLLVSFFTSIFSLLGALFG